MLFVFLIIVQWFNCTCTYLISICNRTRIIQLFGSMCIFLKSIYLSIYLSLILRTRLSFIKYFNCIGMLPLDKIELIQSLLKVLEDAGVLPPSEVRLCGKIW